MDFCVSPFWFSAIGGISWGRAPYGQVVAGRKPAPVRILRLFLGASICERPARELPRDGESARP